MIRDPSDGSVKEIPSKGINLQANEINGMSVKRHSKEITSGLPITNHKAEYLERLEKSREWLKGYFNPPSEQAETDCDHRSMERAKT